MHYSVHIAKIIGNLRCKVHREKNAELKCSKISTLQNCQIKMQLKYRVLQ